MSLSVPKSAHLSSRHAPRVQQARTTRMAPARSKAASVTSKLSNKKAFNVPSSGYHLDDNEVANHVPTLDRDQTRVDQFRSRHLDNYNPRHKVVINVTEEAIAKAERKARKNFVYEETLKELNIELVHLQEYVKKKGLKVVILFEGRDAAGKGGTINIISSAMSPRVCRICALGVPTEKQKSQWYFQRYVEHLPSAGEIVLFDRSWYNRAGVERVMGFCTDEEYEEFMRSVPLFEEMLTNSGVILLKYWFSVSSAEQEKRFIMRMSRSWKRWKLSPMDLFSRTKWDEYSQAKDVTMERTATKHAPWWIIPSTVKKEARLNCISHVLSSIDYEPQKEYENITLPPRGPTSGYIRPTDFPNVTRVPLIYNSEELFPKKNKHIESPANNGQNGTVEAVEPKNKSKKEKLRMEAIDNVEDDDDDEHN